ncbi:MAG: EF-hand domain-containing protein [Pseudomonadota bacterium]
MPKTRCFITLAATVLIAATTIPASAQTGRLAEVDLNQDGAISRDEATQARREMFSRLDRNADGQVSAEEMKAARSTVQAAAQLVDAMIVLRTRRMDVDGNGTLSIEEFMAENPMFDRVDRNGDGIASAEEIAEIRAKFANRRQ